MGSRYGGLKQLDAMGPNGEAVIDYSVFDAMRAGFGKVVFIIRKDFEQQFKEHLGARFEDKIEVAYAFCMQRRHMRYVDLEGYEPGPYSPRKPSDMKFPDFPDCAYPGVVTHPISGRKVLGIVEQFLDRVVTPHQAGLSNDEAIELLERLVAHTRKPEFHYFHEWREGVGRIGHVLISSRSMMG